MALVLGISLGTRHIGIAVVNNGELIDWQVCNFPQKWSAQKLKYILQAFEKHINRNKVQAVAVKIPDVLPVSVGFMQLVGGLNVLLERKRIQTQYCTLSELKQHFCPNVKANKARLADCILEKYPDLHHYKHSSRNIFYYSRVFEALAAAYRLQTMLD